MMRHLATVGLLALLSACAAMPFEPTQSSVTVVERSVGAPRPGREEQLAAYWAARRNARIAPSAFSVSHTWATQNFPRSVDSQDQSDLDSARLERESAAVRFAVSEAIRR